MGNARIIRYLGVLFIVVGLLHLSLRLKGIWLLLTSVFHPSSFRSMQEFVFYGTTFLLFMLVLPIGVVVAGYGLIRLRKWSWMLSLVICVIRFLLGCYGTITLLIASYKLRGLPQPKIPEGTHVVVVSVWPTYMHMAVCALLIVLLTRKPIRDAFNR